MTIPPLPLFARFKHAVARWLLADEAKKLDLGLSTWLQMQEDMKQKKADFEAYKASLTVTDLVREQLKGLNPRLLDEDVVKDEEGQTSRTYSELPEVLGEVESQEEFLAKCKSLKENPALDVILDYITRNQILYSAKEAVTLETINFGRATVNGVSLVREEVARLATVYAERHPANKPEFDEHEVV